jgi:hypothetical protein
VNPEARRTKRQSPIGEIFQLFSWKDFRNTQIPVGVKIRYRLESMAKAKLEGSEINLTKLEKI